MELGCDKFPSEVELYPEWKRNKEALLSFMESVSVRKASESEKEMTKLYMFVQYRYLCRAMFSTTDGGRRNSQQ